MGRGWKVLGVLVFGAMLVPQVQGIRAASAAVVCRKRTGVLVQRERCKRGEASVDLSGLGAVGPQGPQGPAGSADSSDQVRQKFFGGTACPGSDASDVMVKVGPLCVDKYEASVWSGPTGGTQYGVTTNDYPCSRTANDCTGATAIHARSVAGVRPSRQASWFQAAVACLNAGKRLLTSAEWQMAAAGT